MKWTPQAIVAIILSCCILLVVCGNIFYGTKADSIERATIWADILKVLIGGLIGYIMSGKNE